MAVKNLIRYVVNFPPELHEYYKEQSEKVGISMSALIVMDLQTVREQKEALKRMGDFESLIKRMEDLKSVMVEEKKSEE